MVEQDRELEDYLAGRSPVSRAYRQGPQEEPRAQLDARIRDAARASAPRFSERGRPRWLLPLSAAAAVLLAFTVLIEMQQEGLDPVPVERMEDAAPATVPGPAPAAVQQEMSAPVEVKATAPPSTPAPVPERRALQKSLPQPFPAAAESAADSAAPAAGAAAPAAPMREEAPAAAMPEATRGARQDLEEESPEAWIGRIRRLLAEGNAEAAKSEYGKFRVRYPEHPLPEDLRATFEVP